MTDGFGSQQAGIRLFRGFELACLHSLNEGSPFIVRESQSVVRFRASRYVDGTPLKRNRYTRSRIIDFGKAALPES
jgi:hypothetical protein